MSLISLAMLQPAVSCVYKWLDDQGYSQWLGIQFRPHVLFPDICLAAAAFEHTRGGMYNLLEEQIGAVDIRCQKDAARKMRGKRTWEAG